MKLYEYQGKLLLKKYGVAIPRGHLITSPMGATGHTGSCVFKAQSLTGGRGKAGGIVVWDGLSDPRQLIAELLSKTIDGNPVSAILVEEKIEIVRELYIALTFRGSTACPILMVCASGGVDIEQIIEDGTGEMLVLDLDPSLGPMPFHSRAVAKTFGLKSHDEVYNLLVNLFRLFVESDATLIEINPLALTEAGLIALDAKVVLDPKAVARQSVLIEDLSLEQPIAADTITYVPMNGTVGLVSDGAGTGMLTLDLIKDAGGEAANFCEMGGLTNSETIFRAMQEVLQDPRVRSLLVVLIGGFNRMDEMAEGIVAYRETQKVSVPITIRMCGNMEERGKQILQQVGIDVYDDLLLAVQAAVSLAEV